MEKKIEKLKYSFIFNNSLDFNIYDVLNSVDIENDNEFGERNDENNKNDRDFEIDESDKFFFSNKKNSESSFIINDKSFFYKEEEMMEDAFFINNNDDKNDYLNLLGIMNTSFDLEKKTNYINSSFCPPLEVKSPKDISNNNISKKTKESSNATGDEIIIKILLKVFKIQQ